MPAVRSTAVSGRTIMLHAKRGTARGLNDALKVLKRLSTPQVPKASRRLVQSYDEQRATPTVTAAVASYNTPYAARQHQEVTWKHPPPQKAMFLSDPLKMVAGLGIPEAAIADRVHEALLARLGERHGPGR